MAKLTEDMNKLRQKETQAIRKELAEAQTALQKARVDLAFGRLPKTSQVNSMRKQIARLQTVLHEKETSHA